MTNCGWLKDTAGVFSSKDGKILKKGLDEGIGHVAYSAGTTEGISQSALGMRLRTFL